MKRHTTVVQDWKIEKKTSNSSSSTTPPRVTGDWLACVSCGHLRDVGLEDGQRRAEDFDFERRAFGGFRLENGSRAVESQWCLGLLVLDRII